MDWVLDACALGETIRGDIKFLEFLDAFKNQEAPLTHRICINHEILDEYKPLCCKKNVLLSEWFSLGSKRKSFFKKVRCLDENPWDLELLIKKGYFERDDSVYVRTALNTHDKLLVCPSDPQIQNARYCLERNGITLIEEADDALCRFRGS